MATTKKIHGGNYVNFVSSSSSESSDEEDKGVPKQEYHHDLDVDTTVCVLNQFILDESILADYGGKGERDDSSDDEIQVLEEFDVENKRYGGSDGDDNNRKGPGHQIMVPEWNGDGGGDAASSESDSKWLGTIIWPLKDGMNPRVMIERDPIGKGRQDSCDCSARGLVDCVGFHVAEKRTKLKLELGRAFYELDLDKSRADTKNLLSDEEEEQ
ncbi:AT-rich interactive domain-containing protein [Arachis hypogaea]|nr:AT-rich interactive domain-containing protein [Arachis hypogaea]